MITLSDLRDYWKTVADWVKGTDTDSKPKVEVDNFPDVQKVNIENPVESVSISNLPEVQDVNITNPTETQSIEGLVEVINLPVNQVVSGEVSISNLPEIQSVNGALEITNLPEIQDVSDVNLLAELQLIKQIQEELKDKLDATNQRLDEAFDINISSNDREYYGLSADEKPVDNVKEGSTFLEIDTKTVFIFDGNDWVVF